MGKPPENGRQSKTPFALTQHDAVDWLRSLDAASVDLAITDPPYESLEKHRAIGTTTRLKNSKASSNEWFEIFPNKRFPELLVELYRVLKKNSHFYMFCDAETMFVAKPIAEAVGFKFWKPLIWDKCLDPATPVMTSAGVHPIGELQPGDEVAVPEGGFATIKATRRTSAPSLRLRMANGSDIIAAREHRFMRADGKCVEARDLERGDALLQRACRDVQRSEMRLDALIPDEDVIHELPPTHDCLWCGATFDSARAAAAHQARWCEAAKSKQEVADELGVPFKRVQWWLGSGRIPSRWATALGIESSVTGRVQALHQNDGAHWFPETVSLDYSLGKLVGLFAAEGNWMTCGGVTFSLHSEEKHLQHHIARYARSLGARAIVRQRPGRGVTAEIGFKVIGHLIRAFVGGERATTKYFKRAVYAAPLAFRQGVFDGLIEGDGHWSNDEQRETLNITSLDLAMFAYRFVRSRGGSATVRRFENDHAGGWRVRFDPASRCNSNSLVVESIEEVGERELVDISIDHPDELFLLGDGVVTHNCSIGMGYHYRARYEVILFFEKGKRKLNNLGVPDIIESKRVYRGYPAEKPVPVSEVLIDQSTEPGELVIDPFCGSGSVGVAAVGRQRRFMGNDICDEAISVSRKRIIDAGGVLQDAFVGSPERGAQLELVANNY